MFQEPKVIPPRMEVEHEIQLFPDLPLLNIGLYRQSVLKVNEVKKKLQQLLKQCEAMCDSTKYLTLWVTHNNCAQEGWDLENVY